MVPGLDEDFTVVIEIPDQYCEVVQVYPFPICKDCIFQCQAFPPNRAIVLKVWNISDSNIRLNGQNSCFTFRNIVSLGV